MITSCIIFLATLGTPENPVQYETSFFQEIKECNELIPSSMHEHLSIYYEHFDEENLYKAVRIGWCESRGKSSAYNSGADDSGIMQFIPNTWYWMELEHGIPSWDTQILTYYGKPVHLLDYEYYDLEGFAFEKVQYIPYYNLLAGSLLAEDTYNRVEWKDWNASKWCWGDISKYEKRWRSEGY